MSKKGGAGRTRRSLPLEGPLYLAAQEVTVAQLPEKGSRENSGRFGGHFRQDLIIYLFEFGLFHRESREKGHFLFERGYIHLGIFTVAGGDYCPKSESVPAGEETNVLGVSDGVFKNSAIDAGEELVSLAVLVDDGDRPLNFFKRSRHSSFPVVCLGHSIDAELELEADSLRKYVREKLIQAVGKSCVGREVDHIRSGRLVDCGNEGVKIAAEQRLSPGETDNVQVLQTGIAEYLPCFGGGKFHPASVFSATVLFRSVYAERTSEITSFRDLEVEKAGPDRPF